MRGPLLAAILGLCASVSANAQVQCTDDETIGVCLRKITVAARGGSSTEFIKVAAEETRKATPDVTALINKLVADAIQPGAQGGSGTATSTVTDLVPWLNLLGVVSDSDASDGSLALDLNFLLPMTNGPTGNNSQLKWVLNVNPEPFEPLVQAFDESIRDARKSALDERLDDTADSELQFSWSLVTDEMGRDFRRNHEKLNALYAPAIFNVMLTRKDDGARLKAMEELEAVLNDPQSGLGDTPSNVKLGDPRVAPLRARLQQLLQTHGTALGKGQREMLKTLRAELANTRLTSLSQLVLLQPQLLLSATHRFRDELVGPESWGVKVTYEKSFASFGDFMHRHSGVCSQAALTERGEPVDLQRAQPCYSALGAYLDEHAADIENQDRMSFSLEYRKVDSIAYSFPGDGVALDGPKIDRLIGSVGYGRSLIGGGTADRVDFRADYDSNLSGERNGKSRFVVSATYTRDILGVTIPFSLVYANRSEYLQGVDKQISLHVGVKFKAPAPAE